MSQIFRHDFTIDPIHLDRFGTMKPSMILYFAQEIAGLHCQELGTDWDSMAAKGLFWAVFRHKIRIHRLPKGGETITVETWPMPTTRVAYPRTVAAYDSQGKELFQVMSLWVLMDLQSRAMVLPGKSGVEVDGILRGGELPTPASLPPKAMDSHVLRRVGYSDLDRNGHMNNVKYLDWVADLLPSDFHRENSPKQITLCYLNEAREGAQLDLGWAQDTDKMLHVEVTDCHSQHRIFAASMDYNSGVL